MRYPALVFVRGSGFYAQAVRLGQRFRFPRHYSHWNHVALLVNSEGDVVEALSRGVVRRNIHRDWDKGRYYEITPIPGLSSEDAEQMLDFLKCELGESYGWLTIVSIFGHLVTGGKMSVGLDGTEICSGLAAHMLERGNYWFQNAADIMPAQLADLFHVRG